jgi:hypothetical protein
VRMDKERSSIPKILKQIRIWKNTYEANVGEPPKFISLCLPCEERIFKEIWREVYKVNSLRELIEIDGLKMCVKYGENGVICDVCEQS